jgi:hypothetical protein
MSSVYAPPLLVASTRRALYVATVSPGRNRLSANSPLPAPAIVEVFTTSPSIFFRCTQQ